VPISQQLSSFKANPLEEEEEKIKRKREKRKEKKKRRKMKKKIEKDSINITHFRPEIVVV